MKFVKYHLHQNFRFLQTYKIKLISDAVAWIRRWRRIWENNTDSATSFELRLELPATAASWG